MIQISRGIESEVVSIMKGPEPGVLLLLPELALLSAVEKDDAIFHQGGMGPRQIDG